MTGRTPQDPRPARGTGPPGPLPQPLVGVAFSGDAASATAWSGTPAGLIRGLTHAGARVALYRADPAEFLKTLTIWAVGLPHGRLGRGLFGPELAALRSLALRRRLEHAGERPSAVIQIGTEYGFPSSRPPTAVYLDMTLALARRMPDPTYSRLSRLETSAWQRREHRAYAAARVCCAMSEWVADSLVRDYGVPRERIQVVGCGRNHSPAPVERDWTTPRFLFVGRDWERKNGPAVLRAFAALHSELPEARLDVVGDHPRIDQPGVSGHGPLRLGVPEEGAKVERLFQQATCFVMPSAYEPYGIVYSEAGAAGVPSIGTTVGGAADAIGPGGRLVDPGDDRALLAAMRQLAQPALARQFGALARTHAEGLTWDRVAARILRVVTG